MTSLETTKPVLTADPKTCSVVSEYLSNLGLGNICAFKKSEEEGVSTIILESRVFTKPLRIGALLDFLGTIHAHKDQNTPLKILAFNGGVLDIPNSLFKNELASNGVRLTEKEIAILVYLHNNKGQIVSRKDLLSTVWEYAENVETHTLETHIYRLRQKIEIDPANPKILFTQENGYGLL